MEVLNIKNHRVLYGAKMIPTENGAVFTMFFASLGKGNSL